jgi:hypothetical protein
MPSGSLGIVVSVAIVVALMRWLMTLATGRRARRMAAVLESVRERREV